MVAEEVRKLAERSQEAAKKLAKGQVQRLWLNVQGSLLDAIVPSISRLRSGKKLHPLPDEQSSGSQINTAITQLSQLTQENSSASEELAATAERDEWPG